MIEAFKLVGKIALDGANAVQSDLKNLETKLKSAKEKMSDYGDKMKSVGEGMSKWVTVPLTALGVGAIKSASDLQGASATIQSELGISAQEAEKLNGVAKNLWAQGFGENIQGVAEKVAGVTKSLGNLGQTDLSYVTKGLDLFERRGWADTQESLRAVKTLMEQFGMSATQATDYLASGFQQNLDYSGEFLDTISEYGTYFSEMGFSGDQFFNTLKSGAESGAFQLDKVGDAMKEFTLRSKDGSTASTEAFQALGLNATEMTNAFNTGGETGRLAFQKVVGALQNTGNETERNKIAVALFGTQYEDLGEQAFDAFLKADQGLTNVEGSAGRASKAFQETFGVRLQSAIRQTQVALEPVGQVLMNFVERILPPLLEKIQSVATWFGNLSTGGQNLVVAIGALVAGFGPLLVIIGSVVGAVGNFLPVIAKIAPHLGKIRLLITALMGPWGLLIAGIGLAITAGVALYQNWDKIGNSKFLLMAGPIGFVVGAIKTLQNAFSSAIPPVDNFGNKVSEATEKSVQGLINLSDKGTMQLNLWSGQAKVITEQMATSLTGTYNTMTSQIISALEKQKTDGIAKQTEFFNQSGALTAEREAEILAKQGQYYDQQILKTQEGNTRINEIIQTASNEHRAITTAERDEINRIKDEMLTTGIQAMSKNEIETKAILERMKANSDEMNAQMASKVVQESIKARDGAIKSANETYEQKIAKIVQMRDESGIISAEEANKLIQEATREKDGTITKANEMHTGVIAEAKLQAGEHVNEVDWSTGEIKKKWQVMKDDLIMKTKEMGTSVKESWNNWVDETNTKLNTGITNMKTSWTDFKTDMSTRTEELKTSLGTTWSNLKTDLETKTEELKTNVQTKWTNFKTGIETTTEGLKSGVQTKFENLKTKSGEIWESLKSKSSTTWNNLKTNLGNSAEGIRKDTESKFTTAKNKATSLWESAKTDMSNTWTNLKSDIVGKAGNIASDVGSKFTTAKNNIMNPINTAKTKILGYIDTIKSKFSGLSLTIPKPKVPKISIKWKTKSFLGKDVTYPTGFDVAWAGWNAKGGIVDGATILGAGEKGKEALLPLEGKYFRPVASMIAEQLKGLNMGSASGGAVIEIPIIINGREMARAIVPDLDREIERQRHIRGRGL